MGFIYTFMISAILRHLPLGTRLLSLGGGISRCRRVGGNTVYTKFHLGRSIDR